MGGPSRVNIMARILPTNSKLNEQSFKEQGEQAKYGDENMLIMDKGNIERYQLSLNILSPKHLNFACKCIAI